MNIQFLLAIIRLAAQVIRSQTSHNPADKIDEGIAIAKIVAAGHAAYLAQVGQPLDEALIKRQEPIV